jgi:FUS-interacting serine-arginine-rich protein 1
VYVTYKAVDSDLVCQRQPRGFGFVQYLDARDAAEAQYYLDHQLISGREITVVFAEENRKKPQEMRTKERVRGRPGFGGRRGSRSRSPRRFSPSPRGGRRSRSHSQQVRGRTPSPGHHGNAPSRSPSAGRSHRRRTRDRSPVPPRRSPSPPHRGAREVQPRVNGRDQYVSRSRSRTPVGAQSNPPRRRRSPSPPGHRRHTREPEYEGSPVVETRRARPSGGGFDQAPDH